MTTLVKSRKTWSRNAAKRAGTVKAVETRRKNLTNENFGPELKLRGTLELCEVGLYFYRSTP
jgi:hypothetical protein